MKAFTRNLSIIGAVCALSFLAAPAHSQTADDFHKMNLAKCTAMAPMQPMVEVCKCEEDYFIAHHIDDDKAMQTFSPETRNEVITTCMKQVNAQMQAPAMMTPMLVH